MSETTAEPTTPTEGHATSEAAAETLLTSTAPAATKQQQGTLRTEGGWPNEEAKSTEEAEYEGAPETYEFSEPEGKAYDPGILNSFSEAAKDANLTQNAAQKILDKMAPALAEKQQAVVKAVHDEWIASSKADKEFGGDKLPENLAVAKRGLDHLASLELKKLLLETGLGNNPEIIRAFYRAGKSISEDGFVTGGKSSQDTRSTADLLYPTSKKE